ncbi:MAG: nitrophenyl compound nitroreductase subunit ArsF family protein [Firmicutes bacterium]|nr:nitrophenyl compound nitroreductase subunit ArsF family protein [Bacillota bacterium]
MNTKKLIGAALLLFAALVLLRAISDQDMPVSSENEKQTSTASAQAVSPQIPAQGRYVVLYYFHTTFRCASCLAIEKVARQVVNAQFKNLVDKGLLQFRPVDVENPQNRHFIGDYQLYSKSLVLVEYQDGKEVRHKNMEGIWQQTSLEGLQEYIAQEIASFVGATGQNG